MQTNDVSEWLLESKTPSIRYLTLLNLLNRPNFDPELRAAWMDMKNTGPIPTILANQTRIGAWANERSYYTPKYTSTHWSLLLLAELGTDCHGSGMRRGAIFMLGETYDELLERMDEGLVGISCFWGNLLRYSLHCDLDDDPRLRTLLISLIRDSEKGDWCCKHNDDRPCAWGVARAMWGLAALPEHLRAWPEVKSTIESGLSFLLEEHQLVKANYPTPKGGKTHSLWFRLNFPLFYQADIMFVLRVLHDLEAIDHPGAGPALQWLEDKRARNGRFRGASPYRPRTWKEMGDRSETDRWVTMHATRILEAAGG